MSLLKPSPSPGRGVVEVKSHKKISHTQLYPVPEIFKNRMLCLRGLRKKYVLDCFGQENMYTNKKVP